MRITGLRWLFECVSCDTTTSVVTSRDVRSWRTETLTPRQQARYAVTGQPVPSGSKRYSDESWVERSNGWHCAACKDPRVAAVVGIMRGKTGVHRGDLSELAQRVVSALKEVPDA